MLTLKSLQQQSDPCPNITGIIMIDCWPSNNYNGHYEPFYKNMLLHLEQFNFQVAVSACYARDLYSVGPLSPTIRDYLKVKCPIIDITDPLNFYENNQTWQIKNWLVVGLTWQLCFHTRPMGIVNLNKHCGQEDFFMNPDFVLTRDFKTVTDLDVRADTLLWQSVSGLGYRLVK